MTTSGSSVMTPRPIVSALSAMPGPDVVVTPMWPAKLAPSAAPDAGDLVLGLERRDAEPLVLAQLVEDVGRRGDRVAAQEHRQVGLAGGGDEPERQGQVAGDLPVAAGRHRGGRDLVRDREDLGRLAEGVAGLEGGDVRVADRRLVRELGGEERERALGRAVVEPGQQAQGEHVLGPGGVLAGQPELLDRRDGHARQVERVQLVVGQRAVLERVGRVADLGQVAGGEVGGVGDDEPAAGHVGDVRLERGRVHRDEHVGAVARRHDVVVGEVELEARHPGQRARRGADLGGEVRQGRDVVAEHRGVGREPVPGELHAVAGVTREADDHAVERADLRHGRSCRQNHAVEPSSSWRSYGPCFGASAVPGWPRDGTSERGGAVRTGDPVPGGGPSSMIRAPLPRTRIVHALRGG